MAVVFKNNAKTTLASSLTSSATSVTVADGSAFPSLSGGDTFFCTFDNGTNVEVVKVTAISSNTLTIVRAQDDTTARAFSTGTVAELRLTAGILNLFSQTGSDINAEVEAYLDANGTTFPDNVKAQFGDSNDLQIYHNGNASLITDVGTGDLFVRASNSLKLQSADGENYLVANANGAVTLYYNNVAKLATSSTGIDVTGTVDMDGFTSVGNGTITGDLLIQEGSGFPRITLKDTDGTNTQAFINHSGSDLTLTTQNGTSNGRLIFARYNGTTTTTSGYFDANGKLFANNGIDVTGTVTNDGLIVDNNNDIQINRDGVSAAKIFWNRSGTTDAKIELAADENLTIGVDEAQLGGKSLIFRNNASEAMRINSDGDISFYEDTGTTANLTWDASADTLNFVDNAKAQFGAGNDLQIYHNGTHSYIDDAGTGNLYIRASQSIALQKADGTEDYLTANNNGAVTLYHNNSPKIATTSTGADITGNITVGDSHYIGNQDPYDNLLLLSSSGENIVMAAAGDIYLNTNATSTSSVGNTRVQLTSTGTLLYNGTQIIDGSRNFTNIGTISSGAITSTGAINSTGTGRAIQVNGTTRINSVGDIIGTSYYIGGTNIIDTSRNLTNIGTINSGATTASGDIASRQSAYPGGRLILDRTASSSGAMTSSEIHFRAYGNNTTLRTFGKIEGRSTGYTDGQIMFYTQNSGTLTEALTIDSSQNATFAGAITSTGTSSFGVLNSSGNIRAGNGSTTGNVQFTSSSYQISGGSGVGDLRFVAPRFRFYEDNTSGTAEFEIDGGNATFTGTISSGAITSSGIITSATTGTANAKVIADGGGAANIEIDRGSTSYHNNLLYRTAGAVKWRIWQSGADNVLAVRNEVAGTNVLSFTDTNSTFAGTISSGAITSTGEVEATALDINGNGDISGNLTLGGYLAGPATFTIDPAAVGDNTGTVVIAGNLQVDGTTTTINSTTMTVDDLNLTLASGAANAAAANGAGITVDGASATITYDGTNDEWDFNKNVNVTGTINSGAITASGSSVFNPTSDMVIVNEPSTNTDLQTVMRIGTAGAGLYLTSGNAIIGKGAYYDGGWIATATSGSSIDFAANNRITFNTFSGATVGGAATFGARAYIDASGLNVTGTISSGAITINGTTIVDSSRNMFTPEIELGGDAEHKLRYSIGSIISGGTTHTTILQGRQVDIYGYDDIQIRAGSTDKIVLTASGSAKIQIDANTNILDGILQIGGSTFVDQSRNITAGTISSGAITSTGLVTSVGGVVNTNTGSNAFYVTRSGATNQALKIYVDDAAAVFESIQDESLDNYGTFIFAMDGGTTEPFFDVRKGTASSGSKFRVDGSGALQVGSNNTTFLDASRNLTNIGTISSGAITATSIDGGSTVEANAMFINTPDGGGSPAMTALLRIYGYEGRGAGIKIRDNVNSAAGSSNREWFIGSGYNQSGFNIGYSATGSQSSYSAQNKLSIDTSGNATFAGTIDSGAIASSGLVTANSAMQIIGATGSSGYMYIYDRDIGTSPSANGFLIQKSGTHAYVYNRESAGKLFLGAGNTNSYLTIFSNGDYYAGSTKWFDQSRNLTNIGTISSGAIASSASITASGNSNNFGNTTIAALSATSGTFSASITASGNSNSFGNSSFGTISSGSITVDPSGTYGDGITINAGDVNTGANGAKQIIMSFGGTSSIDYAHSIRTRHDSGSDTENTIEFWLWDYGTDSSSTIGTKRALVLENSTGLDLLTGGYKVGGTTVIDSSRNLTNIGTLNTTAFWTTSAATSHWGASGAVYGTLTWDTGYASIYGASGAELRLGSSGGQDKLTVKTDGNVTINGGALQMSDTTVIDSSRNLTNIGTINSGSILVQTGTPTLRLKTSANSNDPYFSMESSGTGTLGEGFEMWYVNNVGDFHMSTTYNDDAASLRFHTKTGGNKSTSNERFTIEGGGDINVVSGALKFGNTETITSSRGLHNLSGDIRSNNVFDFITQGTAAQSIKAKSLYVGTTYGGNTPSNGMVQASIGFAVGTGAGGTTVIDASRNLTNIGTINSGTHFIDNGSQRVKYSVWSGTTYGIGMGTGYTFGGINNDYVMSHQMNNDSDRGFWWGDDGHTNAQGAMALTTNGLLTVASGIRVGYGETDTTIPSSGLDVNGTIRADGGNLIMGDEAYSTSASYVGMKTSFQSGSSDYMIISGLSDGGTYVSAKDGGAVYIRGGGNNSANQIVVPDASTITATTSDFRVSGNVTAYASDERLKTNIKTIENPIEKIKKIRGVEFDWLENIENFNPKFEHETGVIAQEIEEVIPDAVSPAPFNEEYKTVDKEKIVALLIEAIKEQQKDIEYMKSEIKILKENNNGN